MSAVFVLRIHLFHYVQRLLYRDVEKVVYLYRIDKKSCIDIE